MVVAASLALMARSRFVSGRTWGASLRCGFWASRGRVFVFLRAAAAVRALRPCAGRAFWPFLWRCRGLTSFAPPRSLRGYWSLGLYLGFLLRSPVPGCLVRFFLLSSHRFCCLLRAAYATSALPCPPAAAAPHRCNSLVPGRGCAACSVHALFLLLPLFCIRTFLARARWLLSTSHARAALFFLTSWSWASWLPSGPLSLFRHFSCRWLCFVYLPLVFVPPCGCHAPRLSPVPGCRFGAPRFVGFSPSLPVAKAPVCSSLALASLAFFSSPCDHVCCCRLPCLLAFWSWGLDLLPSRPVIVFCVRYFPFGASCRGADLTLCSCCSSPALPAVVLPRMPLARDPFVPANCSFWASTLCSVACVYPCRRLPSCGPALLPPTSWRLSSFAKAWAASPFLLIVS